MDKIINLLDVDHIVTRVVEFLPDLLAAVIILFIFWLGYRISRKPLRLILQKTGFHDNLIKLLVDNIYKSVVLFFSIVTAGGQIGLNIGAMLAGFGVAGIAIGFAAQDSLANTIAGFMIFESDPNGQWCCWSESAWVNTPISCLPTFPVDSSRARRLPGPWLPIQ